MEKTKEQKTFYQGFHSICSVSESASINVLPHFKVPVWMLNFFLQIPSFSDDQRVKWFAHSCPVTNSRAMRSVEASRLPGFF